MKKDRNDAFEVIVVNGKAHYLPSTDELKALKKIIVFLHDLNYDDKVTLNKAECLYDILNNERKIIGGCNKKEFNPPQNSTIKFIEECCVDVTDSKAALSTAKMWEAFCYWCKNNNEYTPKRREFTKNIAERYNTDEFKVIKATNGKRYYPFTLSKEYCDKYLIDLFKSKLSKLR